jgi:hypothetical protein
MVEVLSGAMVALTTGLPGAMRIFVLNYGSMVDDGFGSEA